MHLKMCIYSLLYKDRGLQSQPTKAERSRSEVKSTKYFGMFEMQIEMQISRNHNLWNIIGLNK